MNVDVRDERFREVVNVDVEMERLATGFAFTEGPIWHHLERHLTFSDIPGDHIHRWTPGGSTETFRKPSNMANGNAYDRMARIVTCEHATSRVTRAMPHGEIQVLASHYNGKELNSPNDVVIKADGRIFFTDPAYGRQEYYGVSRSQDIDFQGVYRIEDNGSKLTLLVDDFCQPNGLCFNQHESRMYINDTERKHIRVFDVRGDGSLSGGDIWAEVVGEGAGAPDGLKIDIEGNVYCAGPGGIHVFGPDAICLGVIKVPEATANFTWGGDDMRSIFITASSSLYRCRSQTAGLTLF
jgi:gluconolactonase